MNKLTNIPEYLTYDDVLLLPNYSEVSKRKADTKTYLSDTIKLSIPIVSSPMDTVTEYELAVSIAKLGGVGIIHRNMTIQKQVQQVSKIKKQNYLVGAAVGRGKDLKDRVKALVKVNTDIICIDSSHGHSKEIIQITNQIKTSYPHICVMSGNVATYEGTKALIKAGADTIRVGMGPGSICTTRVISGMGVPQLTAVSEAVRAARGTGTTIIADGGIRSSGDIVKALAIGAHAVMLGSLLAGTDESPGQFVFVNGRKYKYYRGMGSIAAMKKGSAERYGQTYKGHESKLIPEGIEGLVHYKGHLSDLLYQLVGGIKAGMSYLGAKNREELCKKARFIKITNASLLESRPHSIIKNGK